MNNNKITKIDINIIELYSLCPALAFIQCSGKYNDTGKQYKSKEELRKLFNTLVIYLMGRDYSSNVVSSVMRHSIFEEGSKEFEYTRDFLSNFIYMLKLDELEITGGIIPFEISIGGYIIESCIDCVIKDKKRDTIHPCVIDLSKTRYENYYNPILYRVYTIYKHFIVEDIAPEIMVLSPYTGKKWYFYHKGFSDALEHSIGYYARSVTESVTFHRFGWWCSGCDFRGLCFKLLKTLPNT